MPHSERDEEEVKGRAASARLANANAASFSGAGQAARTPLFDTMIELLTAQVQQ